MVHLLRLLHLLGRHVVRSAEDLILGERSGGTRSPLRSAYSLRGAGGQGTARPWSLDIFR